MKNLSRISKFLPIGFIAVFSTLNSAKGEPASAKSVSAVSHGKGTPKIQFETNYFDLGKLTSVENISGSFKFKNVGDGVLKIDPPQASCDCTEPFVKPDTVAPGES